MKTTKRIITCALFIFLFTIALCAASYATDEHNHCVCGKAEHTDGGTHTEADLRTFTAWESSDSLPTWSGCFYLTTDVTLERTTWNPAYNTVLCLNGHTIKGLFNGAIISIPNNGYSFTLCDCKENKGLITHNYSETKITGFAIKVGINSTFTMYGGRIADNSTSETDTFPYSAVGNFGTFRLFGGIITDNIDHRDNGGAVYNSRDMYIAGDVTVTGNKKTVDGRTSDANIFTSNAVKIAGALTGGKVGISAASTRTLLASGSKYTITDDDFAKLACDKKGFYLVKNNYGIGVAAVHTHCICGTHKVYFNHIDESTYGFAPWDDPTSLPTKQGYYYLTTDVTLTEPLGESVCDGICLNGHSIRADGDFDIIKTSNIRPSQFFITDCAKPENYGSITHINGHTGRALYVDKNLRIFGCKIENNSAENGGAIYIDGDGITLNIFGTVIENNTATENGGAIYIDCPDGGTCGGKVTLEGAKISKNSAKNGGAVYNVGTEENRTVDNIGVYSETLISGNTATEYGGGIYHKAGRILLYRGAIKENTAKAGGGIYTEGVDDASYPLIMLEDAPYVYNNTNTDGKQDNINLGYHGKIDFHNGIIVNNDLTAVGKIGVSVKDPSEGRRIVGYNSKYVYSKIEVSMTIFVSDDDRFAVKTVTDESLTSSEIYACLTEYTVPTAGRFTFRAPHNLVYSGEEKKATVTPNDNVDYGYITIKYYRDGELLAELPTDAGEYSVRIDVSGSSICEAINDITSDDWCFAILAKELKKNDITVTGIEDFYHFTGKAYKPEITVKYGQKTLKINDDYTVTYGENTKVGVGSVTVEFCGNYSGSAQYEFEIKRAVGDIFADGVIDTKDSVLLAQYLAGWKVDIEAEYADVNGDDAVDSRDMVLLMQYIANFEGIVLGKQN